jgi:cellulose synthase/poly-beta-1,6-N-acetylglucosamine synthase-like glycosyltransferase
VEVFLAVSTLYGSNLIVNVLFFAAIVIVVGDILATLFTIFYQRYWYDRFIRSRFDASFNPKCSIIVPCKGVPRDLGKNLEGFLELDYNNFEVVYVTESESDAAVPVIRQIVERHKNAKIAFAGLSKTCAQKNYNLLAALKLTDSPDVYVFADSDIRPAKNWLKELVTPLSSEKVAVTSGFRWLHAVNGTVGELTHSYVNVFMYVCFVTACSFGGVGLWGGSMAIRRKDFDTFGVAEKWAKAGVDDMSLSRIVQKNRKKAILVPQCVTHTDDPLPTVKSTVDWFERQIMYLKAHFKPLWFFAVFPLAVMATALIFSLPFALFASISSDYTFFGSGGGPALIFYIGEIATLFLYPFLGKMHKFPKFVALFPMMRMTHAISYFKTMMTNTITWAGIKYTLNFSGEVSKIERPSKG